MATVVREIERKYDPAAGGTAGARLAATATKLQRALGGRLPAAKAVQEPQLTAASPAAEVVLAYVGDQVAAIWRHDSLVRRDEPDAVHQMRVDTFAYGLMYQGQVCQAAKIEQALPRFAVPRSSSPHGHAAS